jgi:hypothetical protein
MAHLDNIKTDTGVYSGDVRHEKRRSGGRQAKLARMKTSGDADGKVVTARGRWKSTLMAITRCALFCPTTHRPRISPAGYISPRQFQTTSRTRFQVFHSLLGTVVRGLLGPCKLLSSQYQFCSFLFFHNYNTPDRLSRPETR